MDEPQTIDELLDALPAALRKKVVYATYPETAPQERPTVAPRCRSKLPMPIRLIKFVLIAVVLLTVTPLLPIFVIAALFHHFGGKRNAH